MKLNKLLEKQVRKYLPDPLPGNFPLKEFLRAVNDSYNSYERDHDLSNRAFKISEEEYLKINHELKNENSLKKLSINRLRQAIAELEDSGINSESDDLLDIVSYLDCQIVKRKKAEEKLRASEELWQYALEGAGEGVWQYNFQTMEVYFSKRYKEMIGFEEHEFPNDVQEWRSRVHPDDLILIQGADKDYLEGKITSHCREYRIRHRNGDYIWILDRGKVINYTEQGIPQRIVGTHSDITKRKEAEEEVRRLSIVASSNAAGILIFDSHEKVSWVNSAFEQITGFRPGDITGKDPLQIISGPLMDAASLRRMKACILKKKDFSEDVIHSRKNGTTFWARIKMQFAIDPDNQTLEPFIIIEDITKEKETQQKISEFEYRFRKALERIGDNVWEHDFVSGNTYISGATKYTKEPGINIDRRLRELSGMRWMKHVHPDDGAIVTATYDAYRNGEIDHHVLEYRMVRPDGTSRWILDRGVVIERQLNGCVAKVIGTYKDITERKLSEQILRNSEEKYQSIIAKMNLGLLEVDNDEIMLFANQSFCEMSGYSVEELVSKSAASLFGLNRKTESIFSNGGNIKKGISDPYELAVKSKNGDSKWWLVSSAPRFNDSGILAGSIGIFLDITDQKKLELDLNEAKEMAEQSVRTKEAFLANMSHEIRTPMNAVLGLSRELRKTNLDSRQEFYLKTINVAAEHLLIVINDILDTSKIEAGKLNLEHIGFRSDEIISHCLKVISHKAKKKGIRLIEETANDSHLVFLGDPFRLTQILLNLVSNAVKFTEKGSVTLESRIFERKENKQTLQLKVKDTGIGMDDEFLKNIFQKFHQEDNSVARIYGGTGLGMSITHQLIALMGGTIDIKSRKGEGTEVTVKIPFTIGTTDDLPRKVKSVSDGIALKGKRILLVEDNEMNRLVASTVLDNYQPIITEVVNGEEAVSALRSFRYDLVLMDLQMPVMDGLEATRVIRREIDKNIPIIGLTANAIKGESKRCEEAGMNAYIIKPFDEEILIDTLARWLKPDLDVSETETSGNSTEPGSSLYDLSKLKDISDKPEFTEKMLNLFVKNIPLSVQEIKGCWLQKNYEQMKVVAHRIKSTLDNMGIKSLHACIRFIEQRAMYEKQSDAMKKNIDLLESVVNDVAEAIDARMKSIAE